MKPRVVRPRQPQLRPRSENHHRIAGEPRLHFDDAIQIDDVAPMDSDEVGWIEAVLEASSRDSHEVVGGTDMQSNVVALSLQPIHIGDTNDPNAAATLHGESL